MTDLGLIAIVQATALAVAPAVFVHTNPDSQRRYVYLQSFEHHVQLIFSAHMGRQMF